MDLAAWTPRALSVLRIVTGLLFLEHGTGKLLGFPPSDHAAPTLFSLIGVQGVLELVGGFLILIGLFTRPVAFILAGDMAVAYFMAHAPKSFFPTVNGGQLAILFCFVRSRRRTAPRKEAKADLTEILTPWNVSLMHGERLSASSQLRETMRCLSSGSRMITGSRPGVVSSSGWRTKREVLCSAGSAMKLAGSGRSYSLQGS
jgi:putative oxidoreductase